MIENEVLLNLVFTFKAHSLNLAIIIFGISERIIPVHI